jgi:hypothetical protein
MNRTDITINVPGVRPNSRIGDLTTKQFVQLLLQVLAQNRAQIQNPRFAKALVVQLGRQFEQAAKGKKDPVTKRILKTQLTTLQGLPAVMNAVGKVR